MEAGGGAGAPARPTPTLFGYVRRVRDFDRNEKGDPIVTSLTGPDRLEATRQIARERAVAAGEIRALHDALRLCYWREGVNHYEACKDLVEAAFAKQKAPYWGMPNAPSHQK
jgi:hypothetical protein